MADSFIDNLSNKFPDSQDNNLTSINEEKALAELRTLLFTNEKEQTPPPQPTEPSFPNKVTANEEQALAELRALLFTNEKEQTPPPQPTEPSFQNDDYLNDQDGLNELRNLLFGSELQEKLRSGKLRAEDVSRVLPEAIILRSIQKDEQLTQAIVPTVEEAISTSVKQDLNVLSEALFPVIGPATRKAVSTALKTLTQSLNETLDHSFSPQSFKWRLEALQTGKSFAEVVLLRTLLYRVEQVFLIHIKTGLVLQHLAADAVAVQDPDLVSAMLTAIQDFVKDSFKVQKGEGLETLNFGELTIWIEQGPQAVLAGVIRGNAPQELRLVFQKTIEKIHLQFQSAFNSFQGDSAAFKPSQSYLEDCLQTQYQPKKATPSPILLIILGSVFLALGTWAFISFQEKQRWTAFVEKLNDQPGIIITTAEKRQGKYFISGLRDPLAVEPSQLINQTNINPKTVVSRWEPYLSFDPSLTVLRAKYLLKPPATVFLKVNDQGILAASGSAPRHWITESRKLVQFIPGVTQFEDGNLIESDLKKLLASKQKIEKQMLLFGEGSTQLLPNQNNKLETLITEINSLSNAAPFHNKNIEIKILGHTNDHGSTGKNLALSQARAYIILFSLVSRGLKVSELSAVGLGITEPILNNFSQYDPVLNRSVTFKVFLKDVSNQTSNLR